MKEQYPSYDKGRKGAGLEEVYNGFSRDIQEKIKDAVFRKSVRAGQSKIRDFRRSIIQFVDIIEKPIKEINLEDFIHFAILLKNARKLETARGILSHVKYFLKLNFKDWSERFNSFSDIPSMKGFNEEKINEGNLLKEDELELLMRTANSLEKKLRVSFSYETGARPQEIRNCKWKDIEFKDNGIAFVTLHSGKTGHSRTIPIKDSVIHLKRWKQEFRYSKLSGEDYIFPSNRDRKKPISKNTFTCFFIDLSKKAGLKRPVFPYLFRHSRLTELYKELPTQIHRKFAGHSRDSKMTAVYDHISSQDVAETMLSKVYNVKDITPKAKHEFEEKIKEQSQEIAQLIANQKVLNKRMDKLMEFYESYQDEMDNLADNPNAKVKELYSGLRRRTEQEKQEMKQYIEKTDF